MATSNSYNYSITRDTIIRSAFEYVGVAVEGEDLDADEITVANRVLNMMLKHFITLGLQVWKRKTHTITPLVLSQQYYDIGAHETNTITATSDAATPSVITVTHPFHGYPNGASVTIAGASDSDANGTYTITVTGPSTYTYTAGGEVAVSPVAGSPTATLATVESVPRPERILNAQLVDSSGNRTSLTELTRDEYDNLPNLTTTGTPIQYHYERRLGAGRFYIWPVADSTAVSDYTIELTYQAPIEDMDASTDDLDMPPEWQEPVVVNLAYRLSQRYGMNRLDRAMLRQDAMFALDSVDNYDYENGSIYFQPDTDGK